MDMYKTIIELKKSTPPYKFRELTTIISGLFENCAGKVKNCSYNPYVLVFKGGEPEWACLSLGILALEDVPGLLGYISKCWWIDEEDPEESSDMLEVFATPVR